LQHRSQEIALGRRARLRLTPFSAKRTHSKVGSSSHRCICRCGAARTCLPRHENGRAWHVRHCIAPLTWRLDTEYAAPTSHPRFPGRLSGSNSYQATLPHEGHICSDSHGWVGSTQPRYPHRRLSGLSRQGQSSVSRSRVCAIGPVSEHGNISRTTQRASVLGRGHQEALRGQAGIARRRPGGDTLSENAPRPKTSPSTLRPHLTLRGSKLLREAMGDAACLDIIYRTCAAGTGESRHHGSDIWEMPAASWSALKYTPNTDA